MPNTVDVWDDEEELIDGMYWSIDLTNVTGPWPDSYQPSVWTNGDDTVFATDEADLLALIVEAYEVYEEELPKEPLKNWRKLKPTSWVEWFSPEDEDDWGFQPDIQVQVEELLFLGRLTNRGRYICGDCSSPLRYDN